MMKSIYIYIASIFILGLYSCQDVIEIDLDEGDPQLVIEGFISDAPGPYQVKLTKSISYFDDNVFPSQTGAEVIISDDEGNSEALIEVSPGLYESNELQGVRGRTYTLNINYEGQSYQASSTIPNTVIPIDSLVFKYEEESLFSDEGYFPYAYFTDPANERNYYRLKIFVNGAPYDFNVNDPEASPMIDDNFWLIDDKFFDGRMQDYFFFFPLIEGDQVDVELQNLDQSTYDYYRTLLNVTSGGGVAPANPISNFDDNALGYFGAYGVRKVEGVVE